jgi:hypothetical protein
MLDMHKNPAAKNGIIVTLNNLNNDRIYRISYID